MRLVFYEMFASEAAFAAHRDSAHCGLVPRGARALWRRGAPCASCAPWPRPGPAPSCARRRSCPRIASTSQPWPRRGSRSAGTSAGATLTEAELIERLDGVAATIAGLEPYTERVFAAAPDLKVVARMGVGYEHVDVAAATRHGVAVAMAFGTNHDAVADHAMALIAAAAHRIAEYDRRVRAGGWGHAAARPAARDHGGRGRLRPHRPGGRQALPGLQHGGAGRRPGRRRRHRGPARLPPGRARRTAAPVRLRLAARAADARDPPPDRRPPARR